MADAVAYVIRGYCMNFGKEVMQPRQDAPLRLIRNCVSVGSTKNIMSTMNALFSDIFYMSASLSIETSKEIKDVYIFVPIQ